MQSFLLSFVIIAVSSISHWGQTAPVELLPGVPDINGRATFLVQPDLPADLLFNDVNGKTVIVRITVDEAGNVTKAECASDCRPEVRKAAESAARDSKFAPLVVRGQPSKYTGTLMYTFAISKVDWRRFGGALRSVHIFDNLSAGPVAAMLTPDFDDEKAKLLDVDRDADLEKRWKNIREVMASLKSKLNKEDAWMLSLGIALRDVTRHFTASRKMDRTKIQEAIASLSDLAGRAPSGVDKALVDDLKAFSAYVIKDETADPDLLRELHDRMRFIQTGQR